MNTQCSKRTIPSGVLSSGLIILFVMIIMLSCMYCIMYIYTALLQTIVHIYRNLIHILYLRKYIIAFNIVRVVLFIKQWNDELLILTFSALSK